MPVEIKELIIRANIDAGADGAPGAGEAGGSADKKEIVSACVEQVLKILERSRQR